MTCRASTRFRGFLPIVIDVETGGLNANTDALLEIAAVVIEINESNLLSVGELISVHVEPFHGARLDKKSLDITGINPFHPLRPAIPEREALRRIFRPIRQALRRTGCSKAVLVGHNSFFDLGFLNAASSRCEVRHNPFHSFTSFDTATLAGVLLGQTVLARALQAAGIAYDPDLAHSAAYDAKVTAKLFCYLVNRCHLVHGELVNGSTY